MDTFEAVFRVLEHGEAVGIFPEGVTHDDPQLKEVKPGAALRNTAILIRAPLAVRRLLRLRSELIAEIESLRPEIQSRLQPS